MAVKILATIGSVCMAAFGVWHFFVPAAWSWYAYISPEATELVVAVQAINVFFSLCLVLIGAANLLIVFLSRSRFSTTVILGLSVILWAARCTLQILYPQGSMSPWLQYGMLTAFITIFALFLTSLLLVIFNRPRAGYDGRSGEAAV